MRKFTRMCTLGGESILNPVAKGLFNRVKDFIQDVEKEWQARQVPQPNPNKPKVLIVGAGAAGIYAGAILQQESYPFEILEANAYIGGRMCVDTTLADFDIELGAEEIHGQHSIPYHIATEEGARFATTPSIAWIEWRNQLLSEEQLEGQTDFEKIRQFTRKFYRNVDVDHDVQRLVEQQHFPPYTHALLNAKMGNEYGTSNARLHAGSVARADQIWRIGSANFTLTDTSYQKLFRSAFRSVYPHIQTGVGIQKVEYHGEKVHLWDVTGKVYTADKVLLTVPLSVLKNDRIQFDPALPESKVQAIQKLGMGAGLKIILKFKRPFWAPYTGSIYGVGVVPEYWVSSHARSEKHFVLTAFVHGDRAELLSEAGENAIDYLLTDLKRLYPQQPIDALLEDYILKDWTKTPYIEGSYSYPIHDNDRYFRSVLAEPIANKVFFAGEACNTQGHFATVHGAMESALEACNQLAPLQ